MVRIVTSKSVKKCGQIWPKIGCFYVPFLGTFWAHFEPKMGTLFLPQSHSPIDVSHIPTGVFDMVLKSDEKSWCLKYKGGMVGDFPFSTGEAGKLKIGLMITEGRKILNFCFFS